VTYNSGKKDKKGDFYILNWDKKLNYEDPEISFILSDMFEESRYYSKRNFDTRFFYFDYYDEDGTKNRIHVYPDTSLWEKEMHMNNSTQENYFWAEEYKNFPIVGLTFEQAKAYCIWRTMMYHYEAGRTSKKHYDPTLKFHLPNKEEWERAAMNFVIINKYNWNRLLPVTNGYQINSNGNYQANFGPIELNSGLYIKSFQDDGISYLCKVKSYEPNFNGLYCMYGNAAEWVNTTPELGDFYDDYFDYLGKYEFNPFRGKVYSGKDTSKTVIYITDPYTDSTFLVEKDSEKHKNLIQKRLDFYHVSAEDSFEEVKKKFLALNSIDESYKLKINELNFPKKSSSTDTVKTDKGPKDIIDGVFFLEEIPSKRNNYIKIYDISSGKYDYIKIEEPYDFYSRELYPAFTRFKQNASALKRAENPFSYPSSSLENNYRLVKGGSWHDEAHYLVLKNSQVYNKDEASCRIGFRIAADAIGNEMNKYDKKRIKKQRLLRKKDAE
jgi:formylglycine-generating enzyme required for sulfatase activity